MVDKGLSIVVWPGGRVPIPPRAAAAGAGSIAVRAGRFVAPVASAGERFEVSPEVYLRALREVDAADEAALLDLVDAVGVPSPWGAGAGVSRDVVLAGLLHDESGWKWRHRIDDGALDEVVESLRVKPRSSEHVLGSVAGVRLALDWLFDLVTLAVEQEWGVLESGPSVWRSTFIERPEDRGESLRYLSSGLNAALRPFHARLLVQSASASDLAPQFRSAGVYQIAALQLFDDIAADVGFRACANPTCPGMPWPSPVPGERQEPSGAGRVFVRQLGGASRSKYRTEGVRFCTRSCASAQLQREHRASKRATKPRRGRG